MKATTASPVSSIEKALDVCEALSGAPRGLSVTELGRALHLPAPTAYRLLSLLKRRGYVRQEEETSRYCLTLKMLDVSFRALGRSELRLHAYPVMREYLLRTAQRGFIAVPANGEVTYLWPTGPDEIAMRTVYGKEMPGHCSIYLGSEPHSRRLTCLRLARPRDVDRGRTAVKTFGQELGPGQRLWCTCAPVQDYTGREVARVGVFGHATDDAPLLAEHNRGAWELGRLISMRLGYSAAMGPHVVASMGA